MRLTGVARATAAAAEDERRTEPPVPLTVLRGVGAGEVEGDRREEDACVVLGFFLLDLAGADWSSSSSSSSSSGSSSSDSSSSDSGVPLRLRGLQQDAQGQPSTR